MKINKRDVEGTWCKYEGKVEFKIRPLRLSVLTNLDADLDNLSLQFNYCLVDWKGIENESGGEFKCNKENKEHFYDYYDSIREFVFEEANALKKKFNKEIKN